MPDAEGLIFEVLYYFIALDFHDVGIRHPEIERLAKSEETLNLKSPCIWHR
jgi:hypothetical protein